MGPPSGGRRSDLKKRGRAMRRLGSVSWAEGIGKKGPQAVHVASTFRGYRRQRPVRPETPEHGQHPHMWGLRFTGQVVGLRASPEGTAFRTKGWLDAPCLFLITLFIHGWAAASLPHQLSPAAVSVGGSSPAAVPGFVTAVARLVAEHRLQ